MPIIIIIIIIIITLLLQGVLYGKKRIHIGTLSIHLSVRLSLIIIDYEVCRLIIKLFTVVL